jgi:hypothetical protein
MLINQDLVPLQKSLSPLNMPALLALSSSMMNPSISIRSTPL